MMLSLRNLVTLFVFIFCLTTFVALFHSLKVHCNGKIIENSSSPCSLRWVLFFVKSSFRVMCLLMLIFATILTFGYPSPWRCMLLGHYLRGLEYRMELMELLSLGDDSWEWFPGKWVNCLNSGLVLVVPTVYRHVEVLCNPSFQHQEGRARRQVPCHFRLDYILFLMDCWKNEVELWWPGINHGFLEQVQDVDVIVLTSIIYDLDPIKYEWICSCEYFYLSHKFLQFKF